MLILSYENKSSFEYNVDGYAPSLVLKKRLETTRRLAVKPHRSIVKVAIVNCFCELRLGDTKHSIYYSE